MRYLLSSSLKAAISVALLYVSLRRVDLGTLGQRLGALDLGWLAAAGIALCGQLVLLALRWRDIAAVCGARMSIPASVRFSFIGAFFNQVLPSTVGGDAARMWLLAREGAGWTKAVYSVLLDRVAGVTALALLVVACLPWTLVMVRDPIARAMLILIGFGALAGAAVFLALGSPRLRALEKWWPTRHLAAASGAARDVCRANGTAARVAMLSIAIHLLTVAAAWCVAASAAAPLGFAQALFLVLPVILIATIPISIAGWGLRESTMVLAFTYAGLAASDGLVISILFGAVSFAVGILGGGVWIAGGYRWPPARKIEPDALAEDRAA